MNVDEDGDEDADDDGDGPALQNEVLSPHNPMRSFLT